MTKYAEHFGAEKRTVIVAARRLECDGNSGLLLIGQCRKADVIAYFSRRGEEEIVINPDHVRIIESVAIGEDSVTPHVGTGEAGND